MKTATPAEKEDCHRSAQRELAQSGVTRHLMEPDQSATNLRFSFKNELGEGWHIPSGGKAPETVSSQVR